MMLPVNFLHLPKGCVNRCIFCTNNSFRDYQIPELKIVETFSRMKAQFLSYVTSGAKGVIGILGNDPSLLGAAKLAELADLIHSKNYDIGFMSTHGRGFSEDQIQLLRDHRLSTFQIPLYGSTADIHNSITRPKIGDAFLDTTNTLKICERLGVQIVGNIRVMKRNQEDLTNIIQTYLDLCPTSLVSINIGGVVMQPEIQDNIDEFLTAEAEARCIQGAIQAFRAEKIPIFKI